MKKQILIIFLIIFSIVVFACKPSTDTYTVVYNANGADGGSVPVDNNKYENSDIVNVLGNIGNLEKDGFEFKGWNTFPDGSGSPYSEGDSFAMGSNNITLYAVWSEIIVISTYTVTYDSNNADSGNVPLDENEYENGDTVTVLGNIGDLRRTGYDFVGWNGASDASGISYTNGDTFNINNDDVVLYAEWELIPTYTVTYLPNGADSGDVPLDENEYENGDTVTVLENTGNLAKDGFTFLNWNTQQDGLGDAYSGGNTFNMSTSNIELFAQWSALPVYTVTFEVDGGNAVNSQDIIEGGLVTKPDDPTKTGYTFAGWYKEDTFNNVWDFDNDTVTEATAIYAKWDINSYTVTFDVDGGAPAVSEQTIDYNGSIAEPSEPSKDGHIFKGWYKEEGHINKWDFSTDTVTDNMTLYAKWFDVIVVNDDTLLNADWDFYEGRDVSFSVTNLTDNDDNLITPGGQVEIISVSNPTNGTVSLSGDHTTITFNGGTAGTSASFEYTARVVYETVNYDESGIVTIEQIVSPPPVIATNDGPFDMNQGSEMVLSVDNDLLTNDVGESGDNSSVGFIEIISGSEVNLNVTIDGDTITVESTGDPYTSAEFQYRIEDVNSHVEAVGTVFFNIGPRPPIEGYVFIDSNLFDDFKENNAPATFEDIFNNWGRFDGNTVYADKAAADASGSSAANWNLLDAGTDNERVLMPDNVTPYNGFFSDETVENYTFEATLYSDDNDDDSISLIIAYAEDNGTPYALSAMRSGKGAIPSTGWGVVEGQPADISHGNMNSPESLIESKSLPNQRSKWDSYYTRVKIERTGDIVKVWTTEFSSTRSGALSLSYLPESLIEVDLSSDTRFEKYRGAKPYGYGTFSQPNSTYYDVEFTGGLDTETSIMLTDGVDTDSDGDIDLWNGSEVWKYTGSGWELQAGLTIQDELGFPRQVTFPDGASYFITETTVELVE